MDHKHSALLIGTFGFIALTIVFTGYAVMAESLIRYLKLSYTQSGLLMSAFAISYASMQIPIGILSDRYGGRKILLSAMFILGIFSLMFYFLNSFETALLIRILIGASAGMILPSTVKLLSSWNEPDELKKAMGILGFGPGLGVIITNLAIPVIIVSYNWQGGTVFTALFTLTIGVVGVFILKDPLNQEIRHVSETRTLIKYNFRKILKKKLILLIMMNFSVTAVLYGVLTWVPLYLFTTLRGEFIIAGLITATVGLAGLIGSYSGSICAKRFGDKNTILVSMLFLLVLPSLIVFSSPIITSIIIIALIGFFGYLFFAPTWTLVPTSVDKNYQGGVFGVFNTISFFLGAFFPPFIIGYVLDVTASYTIGFVTISLMAIPGIVAALLLKP